MRNMASTSYRQQAITKIFGSKSKINRLQNSQEVIARVVGIKTGGTRDMPYCDIRGQSAMYVAIAQILKISICLFVAEPFFKDFHHVYSRISTLNK